MEFYTQQYINKIIYDEGHVSAGTLRFLIGRLIDNSIVLSNSKVCGQLRSIQAACARYVYTHATHKPKRIMRNWINLQAALRRLALVQYLIDTDDESSLFEKVKRGDKTIVVIYGIPKNARKTILRAPSTELLNIRPDSVTEAMSHLLRVKNSLPATCPLR